MDINILRSLFTVIAFLTFVGIVLWAFSSRSKAAFDRAAMLPFDEDEELQAGGERK
jgi:cytochrome c oxidase cbb3-type subunit 4